MPEPMSLYARVGGDAFFRDLVERFYVGVEADATLRPLYPADLGPGKARLAAFLIQYWGGPQTYTEERGQPRLRMRHVRFAIGARERAAWLARMTEAVRASGVDAAAQDELIRYFEGASRMLVNRFEQFD
jgi:hemoglobin